MVRARATVQGTPDHWPTCLRGTVGWWRRRPVGGAAPDLTAEKGSGPGPLSSQVLPASREGS